MHRIDTATAQKDKFGAGKDGFTRGNPQTGTPATDLDDDYFDMLQEELVGVVESAGIELDKSKHDQLLTALNALFLQRTNPFGDIKNDGAAAIATALTNLGLVDTDKLAGRLLAPPMVITASGQFLMPSKGNLFRIRVQGAGGGSGSTRATSSTGLSASGGGGAGAYVELWLKRAELQAAITAEGGAINVSVGAGGIGGVAGAGGDGGATSFGSLIVCPGGKGSPYGATATTTTTFLAVGGVGGDNPTISISGLPATQIILQMAGAPGHFGISVQSPTLGGHGANSPLGNGGVGSGTSGTQSGVKGYGSGAGGASNGPSAVAKNGFAGADGVIMLEVYA